MSEMKAFQPPKRILMPTDLSLHARGAMKYAVAMAKANHADLFILHVLTEHKFDERLPSTAMEKTEEAIHEIESLMARKIDAEVEETRQPGVQVHTATRWAEAAYDAILAYAEELEIDAIVMGTRGRTGLSYVLLGSVTERVVRHAKCPVMVIAEGDRHFISDDGDIDLRRILFPTDLSGNSDAAAPLARAIAEAQNAEIVVAHVVPSQEVASADLFHPAAEPGDEAKAKASKSFQARAEALFEGYGKIETVLAYGSPAKSLLELIDEREVDLVVMASSGRDSLGDHLLGSVSERMLRLAPCPVCVVK